MKAYITISDSKIMGNAAVTFKVRTAGQDTARTWNVKPSHARHQQRVIEQLLKSEKVTDLEINDTRID